MKKSIFRKGVLIGIILLCIGTYFISSTAYRIENTSKPSSLGNWLFVGGAGPGNYTKIQDAIDDASTGDTIFVFNGVYDENLMIHNSITLLGENRNNTFVEATKQGAIISVCADSVTINGFTVKYSGWLFRLDRIGIQLTADNASIFGNIITRNRIGISVESSYNLIQDNLLVGNVWGIQIDDSSNNTIQENLFRLGVVGIDVFDSADNDIHNNTLKAMLDSCIILSNSYRNMIQNNSFSSYLPASCNFESTATSKLQLREAMRQLKILARTNIWSHNYWNRPRFLPYPVSTSLHVDVQLGFAYLDQRIYLWDLSPAQTPL